MYLIMKTIDQHYKIILQVLIVALKQCLEDNLSQCEAQFSENLFYFDSSSFLCFMEVWNSNFCVGMFYYYSKFSFVSI